MSSQETTVTEDTFLDRWGHWVLWMGPFIAVVSILAWTPRLLPLLIGVEIIQFTLHTSHHHTFHPMSGVLPMFFGGVLIIFGVAMMPSTESWWLLLLLGSQMAFSDSVHDWIHRDRVGDWFQQGRHVVDLVTFTVLSFVALILMIGDGDVPCLPFLRAFPL